MEASVSDRPVKGNMYNGVELNSKEKDRQAGEKMNQTDISFTPIAYIHNGFHEKFGIPRQSGLIETESKIIMEPDYRVLNAFRGLEAYSHVWLIWQFSRSVRDDWSPTVRPPRLGGNQRVGVFATRSPFRPNEIGLSCVKLDRIETDKKLGPVLYVTGADLANGTPILDIKPYLPYVDSHPEASGGFAHEVKDYLLEVDFPEEISEKLSKKNREIISQLLAQDPRPSYQENPDRVYGMRYADMEIKFKVKGSVLYVIKIEYV